MITLIVIIIFSSLLYGFGFPFALLIASGIWAAGIFQPDLSLNQQMLVAIFALGPLLVALAVALILRHYVPQVPERALGALALALAGAVFLSNNYYLDFSEQAAQALSTKPLNLGLVLAAFINAVAFCCGLVLFIVSALILCCELPLYWWNGSRRPRLQGLLYSVRLALILVFFTLSFSRIVDFFLAELSPLRIFKGLVS